MKITEVIDRVKKYHKGEIRGQKLDPATTKDQILYGNPDVECTGVVTTCFASSDVIRRAHAIGANLIISHEALFWNHGDHQDWLADNKTYIEKKKLLDDTGITVWRDHDYIHSGIPVNGIYVDGIFHGVMKKLGWENYLACSPERPLQFDIAAMSAEELSKKLIHAFNLNEIRVIGARTGMIHKVGIVSHVFGPAERDNQILNEVEKNGYEAVLTMELTDFTLNEYVRDSAMLGMQKTIFAIGHFNLEEPGMEYMTSYLPEVIGEGLKVTFLQSADGFTYMH